MTNSPDWARVKQILHEALEADPGDREAFLRQACGDDDALRAEVQSLLDAHGEAGEFADRPAVEILGFGSSPVRVGSRIGAYDIHSRIGGGGMGEVFRAHDTALGRDVAVKVLSPVFSLEPGGVARLEREARLLAALNHPNICAIHGVERTGDGLALILELVEGPPLAERLARGPLPLREALAMARQIAEALEAAHEKGIIHRDLKPANIKVTPDGLVKVLDFGLAREAAADAVAADSAPQSTLGGGHEPVLLGTAAYMSPQQARGQRLDKRTDIWAFGCVLYEMLSGRRAFGGSTSSDAIAAVLEHEPDWPALPDATPEAIRTLLERCLEKDVRLRLRDIGDARLEIDRVTAKPSPRSSAGRAPGRRRPMWPWALAAALGLGALIALGLASRMRTPPPSAPTRVSVDLGADAPQVTGLVGQSAAMTLSPDGRTLAFVAGREGRTTLYVRGLDQLRAVPLTGTEGAINQFFSPDGAWIAFFAGGNLKKISTTGTGLVTLCRAPDNRGGVWAEDGTIIFAPQRAGTGLWKVSSEGGTPEPLTTLDAGEVTQRWPHVLPGGKGIIYTSHSSPNGFADANVAVRPLPDGARKILVRAAYYGRYLASGHLIYVHDSTLFAAPFDLDRLEVTGPAIRALDDVMVSPPGGHAQVTVSRTGTLVYRPGPPQTLDAPIEWADREGRVTALRPTPTHWLTPVFSPDGRTLAMAIFDGKHYGIWLYDWQRDASLRLTYDLADSGAPVWTADGRHIVFGSARDTRSNYFNLYWQRADGSGGIQRLTSSSSGQSPSSFHPHGKLIAFTESHRDTGADLMMLPVDGDDASGWKAGTPRVFLNSRFAESEAIFSPDGRWLAYVSNESGRDEVYVQPFPGPGGGKVKVSSAGGINPAWSPARHELFFATPDRQVMVASYSVERDVFRPEKPRLASSVRFAQRVVRMQMRQFALHPDGERFALAVDRESERRGDGRHATVIFNFFEELHRLARTAAP